MKLILAAFALLPFAMLAMADDKKDLPPAPSGFDSRRENIERGKLETIEYDSKAWARNANGRVVFRQVIPRNPSIRF